MNRRTLLRTTALAGLAGVGVTGTANASASEWNEITFCAGDDTFIYRFEATGEVKRGGAHQSDPYDEVDGSVVSGAVDDRRCDSFLFTGDVEDLKLSGPGKVTINGEPVEDTTETELPNTITIEAKGERVAYEFRVSGRVEKTSQAGNLGVDQILQGTVVRGKVGGEIQGNEDPVDVYRYSGALAFEQADGPLTVTLDVGSD